MQQPEIMTLTQPAQFESIINDYYTKGQLSLKLTDNNLPVEFVGHLGTKLYLNIPNYKNLPSECLIIAKLKTEIVYGTMKQVEPPKEHVYIFTPVKFQVITFVRRHYRIDLDENNTKQIIFMNNVICPVNLEISFENEKKKVDQIKTNILTNLGKLFDLVKVFFVGEKIVDTRFRHFTSEPIPEPIYIPNINEPNSVADKKKFENYKTNIYLPDFSIKSKKIISEITVPLLIDNKMPYGYIQINSNKVLSPTIVDQIKTYAQQINKYFVQNSIFRPLPDKFLITNVSSGGFAIAFKDKKYIRLFPSKTSMLVEMQLPNDQIIKSYSMACHTTPDNNMISIGFQIVAMDDDDRSIFEEFIKSVS